MGAVPPAVPALSPSAGQLQTPGPTAQGAGEGFRLTPVPMWLSCLLCCPTRLQGLKVSKEKGESVPSTQSFAQVVGSFVPVLWGADRKVWGENEKVRVGGKLVCAELAQWP